MTVTIAITSIWCLYTNVLYSSMLALAWRPSFWTTKRTHQLAALRDYCLPPLLQVGVVYWCTLFIFNYNLYYSYFTTTHTTTALTDETSRKRPKVDLMQRFLEPNFSMFESQELQLRVDEYGASIDDLPFRDIQSADLKWWVLEFLCICIVCRYIGSMCILYIYSV